MFFAPRTSVLVVAASLIAAPAMARETKEQVEKRRQAAAQLIIALDDGALQKTTVAIATIESTLTPDGLAAFKPLRARLAKWRQSVAAKTMGPSGDLERDVAKLFGVDTAPAQTPDLPTAVATYVAHCAPCHGAGGAGDGPLAPKVKTGVPSFIGAARAATRAPFVEFHLIAAGRPDTAMPAFGEKLDPAALWSVAFYITGFQFNGPKTNEDAAKAWNDLDAGRRSGYSDSGFSLSWLASHDLAELRQAALPLPGALPLAEVDRGVALLRGTAPFVRGFDSPRK